MKGRFDMSRRKFLQRLCQIVALSELPLSSFGDTSSGGRFRIRQVAKPSRWDLVAVKGKTASYEEITERAVKEFGGIGKFVRKGDRVVITANMAFQRTPEQAATTHPLLIRKMVELCQQAGASKITCLDYTTDDWRQSFEACGVEAAIRGTTATLLSPTDPAMYEDVDISRSVPKTLSNGKPYECIHKARQINQKIPREILECDSLICMPIVKSHVQAVVTISLKMLMGDIWHRNDYHRFGLDACIAELNMALRPTLILADATRVLQTNGPKGPGEVTSPNTVVAGVDPVAVDSYCTRFLTTLAITPYQAPHLILANQLGRGEIDCGKLKIKEMTV
jgi:uncharacterized protein (DUF362 family)